MGQPDTHTGGDRLGTLLLVLFPALKLLLHLSAAYGYGYDYHRDELYYLVCANRLDWGYVDHPPFAVLALALTRAIVGDSFPAIRIVPALAGALTVFLVGLTARDLGGRALALALAMVVAVAAPFYVALDAFFSMNAIDLLVWATAGWLLVRILQDDSRHLWLVLGLVLGVGLENKIGVLWLGAGLAVGLILSPQRTLLATRGPWLAGAIALSLFVPHVAWQLSHGWPTAEFIRVATSEKLVHQSFRSLVAGQVDGMLSLSIVILGAGFLYFIWLPQGRRFRVLGWSFLTVVVILVSTRSVRGVYFAPAYLWLLPGGAVTIEAWLSRKSRRMRRAVAAALLVLISLQGLGALPFVLPILPQDQIVARSLATGAGRRVEERTGIGLMPEFLGNMNGWKEIVEQIAAVHASLPLAEQRRAAILLPDYGMAAAVDILGAPFGLPQAISGHNSYWMWGPGENDFEVAIIVGRPEPQLRAWFEEVTFSGTTHCTYCLPYESNRPIWIVRRPRLPVRELWSQLKLFG